MKRIATPNTFEEIIILVRVWLIAIGTICFLGWSLWVFVKPIFGDLGWIKYESPTQIRYQRFISGTIGCTEKKIVYSKRSAKYPVFHLFDCNGVEKIWSYKVEVIRKSAEGKWTLE